MDIKVFMLPGPLIIPKAGNIESNQVLANEMRVILIEIIIPLRYNGPIIPKEELE